MNPEADGVHEEPAGAGRWVRFWLGGFFLMARECPWVLSVVRPLGVWGAVVIAGDMRRATGRNLETIKGERVSLRDRWLFTGKVVGSFFDFVVDVARFRDSSAEQLRAKIRTVEGQDQYMQLRKAGKGAVLVTAHIGSFEVGLAALTGVERAVNVVFRRDSFGAFEQMRGDLRAKLGVREAPIDEGFATLLALRDALERDEVVVIQGDRAVGGQRSRRVRVLSGEMNLPVGVVTLARINQSPVVPVFVVRERGPGKDAAFRVVLGEGINVADAGEDEVMARIGNAIEGIVRRYPEQWLVLHDAFATTYPPAERSSHAGQ